jgi:5-deoxy-D-glucuronate isomerase
MKISIERLKEIIMEEVARATEKEVSADDLYLAEVFETSSGGEAYKPGKRDEDESSEDKDLEEEIEIVDDE